MPNGVVTDSAQFFKCWGYTTQGRIEGVAIGAIVTPLKLTFFHHNFVILEKNIRVIRPMYRP